MCFWTAVEVASSRLGVASAVQGRDGNGTTALEAAACSTGGCSSACMRYCTALEAGCDRLG